MELYQIAEFLVDDFELLPDELLKQEDVPIFVDVIQSVDVRPDSSSELPPVCRLETLQAVWIWVDVLQLTDVDEVLGLHQPCKQFKVVRNI